MDVKKMISEALLAELSYGTVKRYVDTGGKTSKGFFTGQNKLRKANDKGKGKMDYTDPSRPSWSGKEFEPKVAATNPPKAPSKKIKPAQYD